MNKRWHLAAHYYRVLSFTPIDKLIGVIKICVPVNIVLEAQYTLYYTRTWRRQFTDFFFVLFIFQTILILSAVFFICKWIVLLFARTIVRFAMIMTITIMTFSLSSIYWHFTILLCIAPWMKSFEKFTFTFFHFHFPVTPPWKFHGEILYHLWNYLGNENEKRWK